jgi:SOS response regulatory protein OraA/RecX
LKSFSKNGKDIVLINWEDMSKESDGRFAYAWLFNISMAKADSFDLENILKIKKINDEIIGNNFLTL